MILTTNSWSFNPFARLLDRMSAVNSADFWKIVLKNARTSYPIPPSLWFLHVAAAESLLCIHAGRPPQSAHALNSSELLLSIKQKKL